MIDPFETLWVQSFNPSKDSRTEFNPYEILQDWRTAFAILRRIERLCVILQRIEGMHVRARAILQRDKWLQSIWNPLKGLRIERLRTMIQLLKDCEYSHSMLKDHFHSAWKVQMIAHSPSKGWRITLIVLRREDCACSRISFVVLQMVEMPPS